MISLQTNKNYYIEINVHLSTISAQLNFAWKALSLREESSFYSPPPRVILGLTSYPIMAAKEPMMSSIIHSEVLPLSTVGVVVEYNPLHNGHLYHLQQSRKITGADKVVAVMSGNFLQRGEPALLDKWARAEMALRAGCDLVL